MTFTRRHLGIHLVLAGLLLGLSMASHADGSSPPAACKGFFSALLQKDYATAWNLLSSRSKASYVEQAAGVLQVSPDATRHLFDTNDPQLAPFWDHIREHAHPDIFVQLQYETQSISQDHAVVRAIGPKGSMPLQSVREGGHWKFGVTESSDQ